MKQKLKPIHIYIICSNQIKEYDILASRKFNIEDETYVIKKNCCYLKKVNGEVTSVSFYIESNPNPFDLNDTENNVGLTSVELDKYIGGDIFNILNECQNQNDRSKFTFQLVVFVTIVAVIELITTIF